MAVVIDASIGGVSSNSFVTLAEAETYMLARLNASNWGSDDDLKNRALVEATRELCGVRWQGTPVSTTQALQWPRYYVANPDAPAYSTVLYASTIIPQRVKDATMELAFQFLNAGTTDVAALPSTYGVIEKTVDVLTTRWADPRAQKLGLQRFPRVWDGIKPLLAQASGISMETVRA